MRCSNRLRPYCNFVNSRISRIIPEVRKPKKLAANRKRDYHDKLESSNFEGCGYEILWLTDQILPTRPKKKLFVVVSLMFSRQAGIDRHRHIPGLKRIRCCFRAGRARWKDYFRTTLSYPDTIRLDMGLTYDRIVAPIVNTVLESFRLKCFGARLANRPIPPIASPEKEFGAGTRLAFWSQIEPLAARFAGSRFGARF